MERVEAVDPVTHGIRQETTVRRILSKLVSG
jgi:hypothetical protein